MLYFFYNKLLLESHYNFEILFYREKKSNNSNKIL